MKASYTNYNLDFKFPAGTSRGVLLHKASAFILLENNGKTGIGECSTIPGLSIDPIETYEEKLRDVCRQLNEGTNIDDINMEDYPSIRFGLETAWLDLNTSGNRVLFDNSFTQGKEGIPINGLVWMGNKNFMQEQIREKIMAGYHCIKLKVGALDFETEIEIIKNIRKQFSSKEIEIRLDANGGFTPADVFVKLERLSHLQIHSVEQPIKPNQWEIMSEICKTSPIPVVLDEELIGKQPNVEMLDFVRPAYIILKPSMTGGFHISEEWIRLAEKQNIGWWITSALESNIGLNAIAQWTASLNPVIPQGLGTGQLYQNNISSPLEIKNAKLFYNREKEWDLKAILQS